MAKPYNVKMILTLPYMTIDFIAGLYKIIHEHISYQLSRADVPKIPISRSKVVKGK